MMTLVIGVTGDGCGTAKLGKTFIICSSISAYSSRKVAVGSSLDEEKEAKLENFSMDFRDISGMCFFLNFNRSNQ